MYVAIFRFFFCFSF
ncbi:pheST operon leader peptide PheM [Serratia symbiotica]|nr:pheST operon leader peptide PheM [Serratia symbiotica]